MIKQRGVLKIEASEINSYRDIIKENLFGKLGLKYTNSSFYMKLTFDWFKRE